MFFCQEKAVIHRIGGLEEGEMARNLGIPVIHRIGGLEVERSKQGRILEVIHRIGGLF